MRHLFSGLDQSPAFTETDSAYLVVDDELVIRAANPAYLDLMYRSAEEIVGVPAFEAFPDNPDDPTATGVANVSASFDLVLRHDRRHRMALQRYDIRVREVDGGFLRRFWNTVNSPVHDTRGRLVGVLHHVEDVTPVFGPILASTSRSTPPPGIVAESYAWNQLVRTLMAETLAHTETRLERDQLRHALESRVVIEQAKGVLMVRLQCSVEEAFAELRRRSRSTQRRIHDVAREVVRDAHLA
jgi:hypothetical protein